MQLLARAVLGVAVAGLTVAAAPQMSRDLSRAIARNTLDAYDQGRYEDAMYQIAGVVERLATRYRQSPGDGGHEGVFSEFAARFGQNAAAWIAEAPADERPRRHRVAAVVALEIADIGPNHYVDGGRYVRWAEARAPIEWACQLLRGAGPPTTFERVWHRAALALIEREGDMVFMSGGPPLAQRERDHAGHAIARFPDEAAFKLAPLLARPELQSIGVKSAQPAAALARRGHTDADSRRRLNETLTALDELARTEPDIAADAKLRAGVLRFLVGELDRSLDDLRVAAFGHDAFRRYIAGMVMAQIHGQRDQHDQAIAALGDAVAAMPTMQTARLSLAARLFASGAIDEARTIVDATLTAQVDAAPWRDPWREYSAVDARFWPRDLQILRAAVTR